MKAYDRAAALVIALLILIIAGFNLYFAGDKGQGRQYRVDAERAAAAIEAGETAAAVDYPSLTAITRVESEDDLLGAGSDYLIMRAGDDLYRFDYSTGADRAAAKAVNTALCVMAAAVLITLAVVRRTVIKPFEKLRDMPYELSRGNLNVELKESRQRFFGRFVWGLNMLRDRLDSGSRRELELRAQNKKLIVSLSHDIKIPLSAIKLYAKALEKGMYSSDTEKLAEASRSISSHADEIEGYVSGIVSAACDDIVSVDTRDTEFYMSEPVEKISGYYADKLTRSGTEFAVERYSDCLLRGDPDRAAEVLQNIMENAVKYGNGVRISVSFSDEEDCRLVSVTSTGNTLPEEELPHIFDSFYRGSNAGSKEGSGMGLYICRTLMRSMNGDIFAAAHDGCMTVTAVFRKA